MKNQNGISLLGIILYVAFIAIIFVFSAAWKSYSCYNYGELTERGTKFTITNGCFIEHKGKFIPRSELERRFIMDNQEK